jgi:hypothetical protein
MWKRCQWSHPDEYVCPSSGKQNDHFIHINQKPLLGGERLLEEGGGGGKFKKSVLLLV